MNNANGIFDIENILSLSNFAGKIDVKSSTIGLMTGFASSQVKINSQTVGKISSFAASSLQIVTHQLELATIFSGDFCASAHKIGSVAGVSGRFTFFGRQENAQKAKLKSLKNISGFTSIYNADIERISEGALIMKLQNSNLTLIENVAVNITLVDSVISEIRNSAGTIHLRGNSKVLKHGLGVSIIHDK